MSSESSKAGNAPSEDTAFLVQKVLECYTTRSAQTLNALYHEVFDTSSTFLDPFVEASPRQEGLLQFFALQRIFSKIVATPNSKAGTLSTDLVHPDSDTKCIRSDCSFQYFWFKEGRFAQWLLPDKTDVEATVCLTVSQSTGKVVLHEDVWHSPSVPKLPRLLRSLNARASNTVFRLLGWEKELTNAGKMD